jgi:hypothetical protein
MPGLHALPPITSADAASWKAWKEGLVAHDDQRDENGRKLISNLYWSRLCLSQIDTKCN